MDRRLRRITRWVPNLPPENLCLNEDSFMRVRPVLVKYRPVLWTLFGGTDGHNLANLTSISEIRKGHQYDFFYDHKESSGATMQIANFWDEDDEEDEEDDEDDEGRRIFFIDGPGGERINDFEVAFRNKKSHHGKDIPHCYRVLNN